MATAKATAQARERPKNKTLEPGAVFCRRYRVLRCLKAGGMGAVYEVVHLETQRRRALKIMLPEFVSDAALRERFRLEATVAAEVDSEHIVETFDAGVDEASGSPFLVMELLRGVDLDELARLRRLTPIEVVSLLGQAALALAKTHERGIVHRDLKPENLFLTFREDGTPRVKILDFGIAKIVQRSAVARTTQTVGTPPFMSPEQIEGTAAIGPATDLYALAHIAFALLTQRCYFDSNNAGAVLAQALRGPTELASQRAARHGVSLPRSFDAWFARAAASSTTARFTNALETVATLAGAVDVKGFEAAGTTAAFAAALDDALRASRQGLSALGAEAERGAAVRAASEPNANANPATAPTEAAVSSDTPTRRTPGSVNVAAIAALILGVVLAVLVAFLVRGTRTERAAAPSAMVTAAAAAPSEASPTQAPAAPAPPTTTASLPEPSVAASSSPAAEVAPEPSSAASASPPVARPRATSVAASPPYRAAPPRAAQVPVAPPAPAPLPRPAVDPTRSR